MLQFVRTGKSPRGDERNVHARFALRLCLRTAMVFFAAMNESSPIPPQPDPDGLSRKKRYDLSVFLLLFAGYFLLILYPILRADRYANDDVLRAMRGNWGWNTDGRLLTNFVMRALEFGSARVFDIAPLPQLLAIATLAYVGVLIARRYLAASASPVQAALIAFPLGAQPFFLHNLSFRFDAFCMALAILFALLPLLRPTVSKRGWILGGVSLLACLNLYQPAICAFLLFALLELCAEPDAWKSPRAPLLRFAGRAAQAIAAMSLYQVLFSGSFKGWIKQRSEIASLADLPQTVATNLTAYAHYLVGAFSPRWLNLFVPLTLIAAIFPVVLVVRSIRSVESKQQRILLAAGALLLVPAVCIAMCGPMLLLRNPVYMPRVMIGVGAALCAALIAMHLALRTRARSLPWLCGLAGVWALGMSVLAAAYGNAAAKQKAYEEPIAMQLANDLAALQDEHAIDKYLVVGSAGLATTTENSAQQFPLLRQLVPTYLADDEMWRHYYMVQFLGDAEDAAFPGGYYDPGLLARACAAKAQVRSAYRLAVVDRIGVAQFKSVDCSGNKSRP